MRDTNYDTIVVLTADMLEDGMILRAVDGREYGIRVSHIEHGQTVVRLEWGTITFTDNAVGCNFLTSYELATDFGMDPEPVWFMFAADATGSIAEMPILASDYGDARASAAEWLDTYDHGFAQAIVVGQEVRHAWQSESTGTIWDRVTHGIPDRQHLL